MSRGEEIEDFYFLYERGKKDKSERNHKIYLENVFEKMGKMFMIPVERVKRELT